MDEREFEEIVRKLNSGLTLTTEEMLKLSAATGLTINALKQLKDSAKTAGLDVGKSLGRLTKDVGAGSASFQSLNPIIDSVANGLGSMAEAIPFAGKAISGSLKVVAEGSKFVIDQLQKTVNTFNELGQVGGLTADGMTGLQRQFLASGMSLDGFKKSVVDNAGALAKFRGTVGQGAEDFSKIVGGIVDSGAGTELRRIGYSADQIGETTASFVAMQNRLGMTQGKTNAQLTKSSVEYAKELDILSKITGQSRKQAQAQIDSALSESRFRSTIELMNRNNQQGAAKELTFFQNQVSNVNDELGQAVRDISSGVYDSEAVLKFVRAGVDLESVVSGIKDGSLKANDAITQLQKSTRAVEQEQLEFAQYVKEGESPFPNLAKQLEFNTAQLENGRLTAKKVQDAQVEGQDKLTNSAVEAQVAMEQMTRQLANFGFGAMPAATDAVVLFTDSLNEFIKYVAEKTGIELPSITGGAVRENIPKPGGDAAKTAPTAVKATAESRKAQAVAKAKAEQVLTLTKQEDEAKQQLRRMELARAPEEELNQQKEKLAALGKFKLQAEEDERKQAIAAAQAGLEAKNERQRVRKLQNTATSADREVTAAQKTVDELRLEQARLEIQQRDNPTASPGPVDAKVTRTREATEARKKAEAAVEAATAERKRLEDEKGRAAEETKAARVAEMKAKDDAAKAKAAEELSRRQQGQVSGPGDSRLVTVEKELAAAERTLKEKTNNLTEIRKELGDASKSGVAPEKKYAKTIENLIIQAESGGKNINTGIKDASGKPTTTATGIGQFTKGTFEGVAGMAKPGELLHGKTFEDYKKDINIQREAVTQLTGFNKKQLSSSGYDLSDRNVYLAHFLGANGAARVLRASDTTPIKDAINSESYESNLPLFENVKNPIRTVGDLKTWTDKKLAQASSELDKSTGEDIKMALGGIITAKPGGTKVTVGEAGFNEAFVPLPDGKTIPVSMDKSFKEFVKYLSTLDSEQLARSNSMSTDKSFQEFSKYLKLDSDRIAGVANKNFEQFPSIRNELTSLVDIVGEQERTSQEILRTTIDTFSKEIVKALTPTVGMQGPDVAILLEQLINLQRDNNQTSQKLLQVTQN